jgi:WD40 repeat protein
MLWNMATGTQLRSFTGFDYLPTWAGFSPDGQLVIGSTMQWGNAWSETVHGDTIVWNAATGSEVLRLDTDQWVNVSLFTEDGRYIITGSGRPSVNGIVVWDAQTGEAVRHFLPTVPVLVAVLVPDSTTILAGLGSGEIVLLDYVSGEEIRRFCCHSNWVRYLDLSSDGRYVISADQSAVVILWDFATGEEIRRFYGHESFAWEARFSPDGQTAYSAGAEGSVIEWQIADQPLTDLIAWVRANRYLPDFTCEERSQYRIEPLCGE